MKSGADRVDYEIGDGGDGFLVLRIGHASEPFCRG